MSQRFNGGLKAYKRSLANKEDREKYQDGWDKIFGPKKQETKEQYEDRDKTS